MKKQNHAFSIDSLTPTVRLLLDYRGEIGRLEFLFVELARGVGLAVCYVLYHQGWLVVAATLLPVAIWFGVVATIKRFRDLGHDPILILPVLMYLCAGFAVGYRYDVLEIGVITLGVYLLYVGGVKGRAERFTAEDHAFDV
jgi:hypothetical protein